MLSMCLVVGHLMVDREPVLAPLLALLTLQHTSNKIHKMTRHPTIYSKPKTNKTHTTFKELLFQIAPAGGGGPAGGAPHTAPGVCPGTIFGPGGGPDSAAPTVIVGRPGEPGVFGPGGGPSGFASNGTAGTGFGSASPVKHSAVCNTIIFLSIELPKIDSFQWILSRRLHLTLRTLLYLMSIDFHHQFYRTCLIAHLHSCALFKNSTSVCVSRVVRAKMP